MEGQLIPFSLFSLLVPRATGIEVLNEAVDRLLAEVHKEVNWTLVDVHISPSSIVIFEAFGTQRQIASCRVRYLSFLGIGRDVKLVGIGKGT
jgi:amyloid beta (A4) precursor protein-binding family B protein 2 (Fe65-like)